MSSVVVIKMSIKTINFTTGKHFDPAFVKNFSIFSIFFFKLFFLESNVKTGKRNNKRPTDVVTVTVIIIAPFVR